MIVSNSEAEISDREWEILLDELVDEFRKNMGVNVPILSDFAVSCAGIYDNHPSQCYALWIGIFGCGLPNPRDLTL